MVAEYRAVAVPVAVESDAPKTGARQPDRIPVVALRAEIGEDDHVIAGAAVIPAVEREELVARIDVMHVDELALETGAVVEPIAPQMDQIAIERTNTGKARRLRPIELAPVRPGAPFQEFLAHENHRYAGSGENQRRA